jgi:hypothetical protein
MADAPQTYEGWLSIINTSTDFEADLIRDRLDEAGIPAVVLTQRDHAFNLNLGDMARVHVMVPPEHAVAAREVVDELPVSDEELTEAALAADPDPGDAHAADEEAMLDSGADSIRFSAPDDDEPVKK